MKRNIIIANLKSNKNVSESRVWLDGFKKILDLGSSLQNKEIIVCPSFTELQLFKSFFSENNLPAELGAQDVSPFDEGAYTGEVNAKQLRDFVKYVIVGHSEQRQVLNEPDQTFLQKVKMSIDYGLAPIFCVQTKAVFIPTQVDIVAYEPIFAVGTGNPDTPENADNIALSIKQKGKYTVLYGGSVTPQNVKNFTSMQNIEGVLVGGASLDAQTFIEIIKNA